MQDLASGIKSVVASIGIYLFSVWHQAFKNWLILLVFKKATIDLEDLLVSLLLCKSLHLIIKE